MLSEKKQLLKKNEVKPIHVPHYDELSVKNLYPQFKGDKDLMQFFPESLPKTKARLVSTS